MYTKALIVTATIMTALFTAPASAKTKQVTQDIWETKCLGWSSEISEIAGALHEATQESGTDVSEDLYALEDAAQERCAIGFKAEKQVARSVEQTIAQAAANIEKHILTSQGSTPAERVLTAALLKLVRSQIQVVGTTSQG